MMNIVIVFSILFSSTSQILLKKGVMQIEVSSLNGFHEYLGLVWSLLTNIYLILGIVFQVIALVIWLYVLRRVEVSYAYPFIALGFIFVMGLSFYIFGEKLDQIKVLGGLVICIGIFILSFSRQGV